MGLNQIKIISKKPCFILILILFVFFVKGIFFAALLPIFQGPDEDTHYFRVQYNGSQERNKPEMERNDGSAPSEEIMKTDEITNASKVAGKPNTTFSFTGGYLGNGEEEIIANKWKHYTEIYPHRTPDYPTLYYVMASKIEDFLSSSNILVRFFAIRFLSVIIGVAIILLSYLASKKIGFSERNSLLVSAIISFQPMLTQTAAVINPDILLIFSFTIFIFGAVSLLKDRLNYKNALVLLAATIIALLAKGPGITLGAVLYFLLAREAYLRLNIGKKKFIFYLAGFTIIAGFSSAIILKQYFLAITQFNQISSFHSLFHSLSAYFSNAKNTYFTSLSYWGNFGSLDASIAKSSVQLIWLVEALSLIGIAALLFGKKNIVDFPPKKYLIFFILLIAALQLSIRFYDWRIFDITGRISIGTPGRYFLPNIYAHIILVLTGLGALFKKYIRFENILKTSFVLVVLLEMYSLFEIIIYRYYL